MFTCSGIILRHLRVIKIEKTLARSLHLGDLRDLRHMRISKRALAFLFIHWTVWASSLVKSGMRWWASSCPNSRQQSMSEVTYGHSHIHKHNPVVTECLLGIYYVPATILSIEDTAGGNDSQKSLPLHSSRWHKVNKVNICNILCILSNLGCCHKRLINKGRAMEIKITCNTHGGWTDNIYIQWLNTFYFILRSFLFISIMGFLGGAVIKNSPVNTGDTVSIPGSWRFAGVGNGNPLQYSCLENSLDRGAWWATVYEVAQSRTWLSPHSLKSQDSFYLKQSKDMQT